MGGVLKGEDPMEEKRVEGDGEYDVDWAGEGAIGREMGETIGFRFGIRWGSGVISFMYGLFNLMYECKLKPLLVTNQE